MSQISGDGNISNPYETTISDLDALSAQSEVNKALINLPVEVELGRGSDIKIIELRSPTINEAIKISEDILALKQELLQNIRADDSSDNPTEDIQLSTQLDNVEEYIAKYKKYAALIARAVMLIGNRFLKAGEEEYLDLDWVMEHVTIGENSQASMLLEKYNEVSSLSPLLVAVMNMATI